MPDENKQASRKSDYKKKVSNELLKELMSVVDITDEQLNLLKQKNIVVGGERNRVARYMTIGDKKVYPTFSFKEVGDSNYTTEMTELKDKVNQLIDKYTN